MGEQMYATVIDIGPPPDPTRPKAIILDLSPVNFLDTVGVKTLRRVRRRRSRDLISPSPPHDNGLSWSICSSLLSVLCRLSGETESPGWWNNVCFVPLCLQIRRDYGEIGVEVLLAGCQSRSHLHCKHRDTKKAVVFFIVIINRQWFFFSLFFCILWGLCCACLRPLTAGGSSKPAGTTFPRCPFIV